MREGWDTDEEGDSPELLEEVTRSVLLVAPDPQQPERHRVLASSKSNLGSPAPALRYAVVTGDRIAAPAGRAGMPPNCPLSALTGGRLAIEPPPPTARSFGWPAPVPS